MKTRIALFAALLVIVSLLLGSVAYAAPALPGMVYAPHSALAVRSAPSFDAPALAMLVKSKEYPMLDCPFNPGNTWAYIEYKPGRYGYAPVQVGETVYGSAKFTVLVIPN